LPTDNLVSIDELDSSEKPAHRVPKGTKVVIHKITNVDEVENESWVAEADIYYPDTNRPRHAVVVWFDGFNKEPIFNLPPPPMTLPFPPATLPN